MLCLSVYKSVLHQFYQIISHQNRTFLIKLFTTMSFKEEKEKYLKMTIEERRKYHDMSNVITVDQIPTWHEYWKKNKERITKQSSSDESETNTSDLTKKISMWQGDITSLEVDAIVNAANSSLMGGGGVDGAIHEVAGPYLKKECQTLGGCRVGEAKITGGYNLPSKYIIHTVGPRGEKPEKLRECYLNSLNVAKENGVRTIAFPCISTGVYGYPPQPAAEVAVVTIKKYLQLNSSEFDRVIFCLFLNRDKDIYEKVLSKCIG